MSSLYINSLNSTLHVCLTVCPSVACLSVRLSLSLLSVCMSVCPSHMLPTASKMTYTVSGGGIKLYSIQSYMLPIKGKTIKTKRCYVVSHKTWNNVAQNSLRTRTTATQHYQ